MEKLNKKEDSLKWTPKKWDDFLQKNYSLSLYHFAVSLVDVLFFPDVRSLNLTDSKDLYLPWRNFWLKRIKQLKKLKKHCQETWGEFLYNTDPWLNTYRETVLQIEEKLKDLPRLIDDLIEKIRENLLSLAKVRGTPSNPLNILFLVWSHFIRDRDNDEVHVQTLLYLLRWLSPRIKGFDSGEEMNIYFKEEDIEDDNLNKELFRYRNNELKSPKEKVVRYKKRFLVPVKHRWLERNLKEKTKPNRPLIVFSTGERLSIRDYLDNNPSPSSDSSSGKEYCPPLICLDFKSLLPHSESWLWQIEILKNIDSME